MWLAGSVGSASGGMFGTVLKKRWVYINNTYALMT